MKIKLLVILNQKSRLSSIDKDKVLKITNWEHRQEFILLRPTVSYWVRTLYKLISNCYTYSWMPVSIQNSYVKIQFQSDNHILFGGSGLWGDDCNRRWCSHEWKLLPLWMRVHRAPYSFHHVMVLLIEFLVSELWEVNFFFPDYLFYGVLL